MALNSGEVQFSAPKCSFQRLCSFAYGALQMWLLLLLLKVLTHSVLMSVL